MLCTQCHATEAQFSQVAGRETSVALDWSYTLLVQNNLEWSLDESRSQHIANQYPSKSCTAIRTEELHGEIN
jgi:hypothetical protein